MVGVYLFMGDIYIDNIWIDWQAIFASLNLKRKHTTEMLYRLGDWRVQLKLFFSYSLWSFFDQVMLLKQLPGNTNTLYIYIYLYIKLT